MKTTKQLERYCRGVANHRRIQILFLVSKKQKISLEEITKVLDCHITTASEHTRRLVQAGLLDKKYKGRIVEHTLSPYGELFVDFLKQF